METLVLINSSSFNFLVFGGGVEESEAVDEVVERRRLFGSEKRADESKFIRESSWSIDWEGSVAGRVCCTSSRVVGWVRWFAFVVGKGGYSVFLF